MSQRKTFSMGLLLEYLTFEVGEFWCFFFIIMVFLITMVFFTVFNVFSSLQLEIPYIIC